MDIQKSIVSFFFAFFIVVGYVTGQDANLSKQFLSSLKNTTWIAVNSDYVDSLDYSAKSFKYVFKEGIHSEHSRIQILADMNTVGEKIVWDGDQIINPLDATIHYRSIGVSGQLATGSIFFENDTWINHFTVIGYDGKTTVHRDESQFFENEIKSKSYQMSDSGEWSLVQELTFKKVIVPSKEEGRVTSIGGIFFKSEDPTKLKAWYQEHLGLDTDDWGTNFEWRHTTNPESKGFTQWGPFISKTKYFEPSTKPYMINYRVDNLDLVLKKLEQSKIHPLDKVESVEYGKFVHILDLEGNKVQLWEAIDSEYNKIIEGRSY